MTHMTAAVVKNIIRVGGPPMGLAGAVQVVGVGKNIIRVGQSLLEDARLRGLLVVGEARPWAWREPSRWLVWARP